MTIKIIMNSNILYIKNILDKKIQRRSSFPKDVIKICKENNILIAYGESDDLLEFRGIIDDEMGAYNGVSYKDLDQNHEFYNLLNKLRLELKWESNGFSSWDIKVDTELEYHFFQMMEDQEIFSIGIIIKLD